MPDTGTDSEGADGTSDERDIEEAWREIGCNGAQVHRALASDDPVAAFTADCRLLYSLFEVAAKDFTLGRLTWLGAKVVIQAWSVRDSEDFTSLHQCLGEPDRRRKADLYQDLARRTFTSVVG